MTSSKASNRKYMLHERSEINEERMDWYERIKDSRQNSLSKQNSVDFIDGCAKSRERFNESCMFPEIKTNLPTRPRNNRIRHFGGSFGCYSNTCDNGLQAKNSGAVGRHHIWHPITLKTYLRRGKDADAWFKKALMGKLDEGRGQSTVEYALISAAFIAIVIGLGALSDLFSGGVVVDHAISAASHGIQNLVGGAVDVFSY